MARHWKQRHTDNQMRGSHIGGHAAFNSFFARPQVRADEFDKLEFEKAHQNDAKIVKFSERMSFSFQRADDSKSSTGSTNWAFVTKGKELCVLGELSGMQNINAVKGEQFPDAKKGIMGVAVSTEFCRVLKSADDFHAFVSEGKTFGVQYYSIKIRPVEDIMDASEKLTGSGAKYSDYIPVDEIKADGNGESQIPAGQRQSKPDAQQHNTPGSYFFKGSLFVYRHASSRENLQVISDDERKTIMACTLGHTIPAGERESGVQTYLADGFAVIFDGVAKGKKGLCVVRTREELRNVKAWLGISNISEFQGSVQGTNLLDHDRVASIAASYQRTHPDVSGYAAVDCHSLPELPKAVEPEASKEETPAPAKPPIPKEAIPSYEDLFPKLRPISEQSVFMKLNYGGIEYALEVDMGAKEFRVIGEWRASEGRLVSLQTPQFAKESSGQIGILGEQDTGRLLKILNTWDEHQKLITSPQFYEPAFNSANYHVCSPYGQAGAELKARQIQLYHQDPAIRSHFARYSIWDGKRKEVPALGSVELKSELGNVFAFSGRLRNNFVYIERPADRTLVVLGLEVHKGVLKDMRYQLAHSPDNEVCVAYDVDHKGRPGDATQIGSYYLLDTKAKKRAFYQQMEAISKRKLKMTYCHFVVKCDPIDNDEAKRLLFSHPFYRNYSFASLSGKAELGSGKKQESVAQASAPISGIAECYTNQETEKIYVYLVDNNKKTVTVIGERMDSGHFSDLKQGEMADENLGEIGVAFEYYYGKTYVLRTRQDHESFKGIDSGLIRSMGDTHRYFRVRPFTIFEEAAEERRRIAEDSGWRGRHKGYEFQIPENLKPNTRPKEFI